MSKKRINLLTRDKLIKAFEDFGYNVTNQSSDGIYKLLRAPNGDSTNYWLFSDRIECRIEPSTCAYFSYSDCYLLIEENSISIIVKNIKHNGVFAIFWNYAQPKEQQ